MNNRYQCHQQSDEKLAVLKCLAEIINQYTTEKAKVLEQILEEHHRLQIVDQTHDN